MFQKLWKRSNGLGKNSLIMRISAYSFSNVILTLLYLEYGYSFDFLYFFTLSAGFIVPILFFIWHVQSGNKKNIAFTQFVIDLFWAGWFAGIIRLAVIPSFMFVLSAYANYVATRGLHKFYRFLYPFIGMALALAFYDFKVNTYSSPYMTYLGLGYGVFHFTSLAYISYVYALYLLKSHQKVLEQKEEIDQQQEEIMMQSEALRISNESLQQLNRSLENKVAERTRELEEKNTRLSEYAFINAHKLRAPVATILGLVQLFQYRIQKEERFEIYDRLDKTAHELDGVIREIRQRLEDEGLINQEMIEILEKLEKETKGLNVMSRQD
jgi:signal transduction histidine kinase